MSIQPEAPSGIGGLRDLPLRALYQEFDRLEHLLTDRAQRPYAVSGRDLTIDALRQRERAVVAEIRRRPGADNRPGRTSLSGVAPPG